MSTLVNEVGLRGVGEAVGVDRTASLIQPGDREIQRQAANSRMSLSASLGAPIGNARRRRPQPQTFDDRASDGQTCRVGPLLVEGPRCAAPRILRSRLLGPRGPDRQHGLH